MGYTPFNWCERCGAAAQGIGEAIPKHTVAPWWQHFGGSPRRLNKPAVYDHTGRKHTTKTKNQKKPKTNTTWFNRAVMDLCLVNTARLVCKQSSIEKYWFPNLHVKIFY